MAKGWTQEQIEKLKRLRQAGASAARVALAVKWSRGAVKAKARELGMPFPSWRTERRERGKATAFYTSRRSWWLCAPLVHVLKGLQRTGTMFRRSDWKLLRLGWDRQGCIPRESDFIREGASNG
jgi:hypothetical protein